ncbi:integrase core domain-containing protein [Bosea thiooxidans]
MGTVSDKTACTPSDSPRENGCIVSLNAGLRNEILDGEIFHTLTEAKISIESCRRHFNTMRSHGELGHRLQKSQDDDPYHVDRGHQPTW